MSDNSTKENIIKLKQALGEYSILARSSIYPTLSPTMGRKNKKGKRIFNASEKLKIKSANFKDDTLFAVLGKLITVIDKAPMDSNVKNQLFENFTAELNEINKSIINNKSRKFSDGTNAKLHFLSAIKKITKDFETQCRIFRVPYKIYDDAGEKDHTMLEFSGIEKSLKRYEEFREKYKAYKAKERAVNSISYQLINTGAAAVLETRDKSTGQKVVKAYHGSKIVAKSLYVAFNKIKLFFMRRRLMKLKKVKIRNTDNGDLNQDITKVKISKKLASVAININKMNKIEKNKSNCIKEINNSKDGIIDCVANIALCNDKETNKKMANAAVVGVNAIKFCKNAVGLLCNKVKEKIVSKKMDKEMKNPAKNDETISVGEVFEILQNGASIDIMKKQKTPKNKDNKKVHVDKLEASSKSIEKITADVKEEVAKVDPQKDNTNIIVGTAKKIYGHIIGLKNRLFAQKTSVIEKD